ncbi:MAG: hypothetical protein ACOCQD_03975 [archaeon]
MKDDYIKLSANIVAGPYLQGVAFLEGVITVVDDWKKKKLITLEKQGYRAGFLASNLAFSVEMFLKTILNIGNIKYKNNHDTKYLFDLLPQDISNIIKSNIKEPIINETNNTNANYFYDEFEYYLIQNKDAFVRWRYYYEKDNQYTFEFLYRFSYALYNYLNEYHDLSRLSQDYQSTFTSDRIIIKLK